MRARFGRAAAERISQRTPGCDVFLTKEGGADTAKYSLSTGAAGYILHYVVKIVESFVGLGH